MSTLQEVIYKNNAIYAKWVINGRREADDELNDSNRELIRAYQKEYPNAKGYKCNKGIVELSDNIYNFGIDILFVGTEEIIKKLNAETAEYKKLDILDDYNGIYLAWT
jgi:hypothetical protein